MAFTFLATKLAILPPLFRPTYDAIFSSQPFSYRWRLLLFQPTQILAALITAPSWLFNNHSSVLYVPTRSGKRRCLVYAPPPATHSKKPRPLHIDIHGGGFIGTFQEASARWCTYLAAQTGAVVISCSHRTTPRHTFPAAHNDIDDIVAWVLAHASDFNADANLLTLGGSSTGGNLALSAAQYLALRARSDPTHTFPTAKGYVGFSPPVNFRLTPQEKPRPPGYPTQDPLSFLLPLFDAYAGPNRARDWDDPRLNTLVVEIELLPRDMLFVVAGIDILMHEQLVFVERLRREIEAQGASEGKRSVEARVWKTGFHGWIELPSSILEKERMEAFDACVELIKNVHRKHGFRLEKHITN